MQPKSLEKVLSIVLTAFIFIFACSNQKPIKMQSINLNEASEKIEIEGEKYRAVIDKEKPVLKIYNHSGILYTQFPLAAQFSEKTPIPADATFSWEVSPKQLILHYLKGARKIQSVEINFFNDGFEIKLGVKFPIGENPGIYCFRKADSGLDTGQWLDYFSPEADSYYDFPPRIDVLAIRDNQWVFCPAPLNLSFETRAGWFSVGLAELPPATQFSLKENAFWLDYHWNKVARSHEELYWIVPFVFTFNQEEWKAVADYRSYLENHDYVPGTTAQKADAPWWRQPLLSTWGEQTVLEITRKHPDFNSEWVKQYVAKQSKNYPNTAFTIIIENQWQTTFGHCRPDDRFKDLKKLIQWCHQQNHRVILWWKSWTAEANSLAQIMEIADGDFVDATHPDFETYVRHCCGYMLGAADTSLNADGLKIADTFLLRNPAKATYQDSTRGIGLQELHLYLKTFYDQAKRIKPDALILGHAQAPHFEDTQDMVSINEDWDNKLRREKRARIITQALPSTMINGDAADLSSKIALYHYVTSTIYATPEIEYLSHFPDKVISADFHKTLNYLLEIYQKKGDGKPEFVEYGWWQWRRGNKLIAESVAKGSAIIFYKSRSEALLFSTENQDIPILLERNRLIDVKDENGEDVDFKSLENQIYKIDGIQKNKFYKLKLRRLPFLR